MSKKSLKLHPNREHLSIESVFYILILRMNQDEPNMSQFNNLKIK